MNHDETELVRRLSVGDETALAEIHRRFAPGIARWLARKFARILPPGETEDILQEASLVVWQRRADIDPAKGSVRALYFGIARKIALKRTGRPWIKERGREAACDGEKLDHLPWDTREPEHGGDETEADATAPGTDAAEGFSPRDAFRAEYLPLMSEILAALSPCELATLLATADGDHPISRGEAAINLGENPNTFRSHLKRARDHVKAACVRLGLPPPDWTIWEGTHG